jgi:hypothetical protein
LETLNIDHVRIISLRTDWINDLSINFEAMLVELPDGDLDWIQVRRLERTYNRVFLTKEHYFRTHNAENIRYFVPTFGIYKLHGSLILFVIETSFDHVVTGVFLNRILEFTSVNILHLLYHILLQAHVGPVAK